MSDDSRQYLLNKSGFPMDRDTMEAVFSYCIDQNKTKEAVIKSLKDIYTEEAGACLPRVYPPHLNLNTSLEPCLKLELIQNYINKFTYNYTGLQFFPVNRKASMNRLKDIAKLIIDAALPIKCLEATILAIFLTQGQKEFKRFTISFCSEFQGHPFRHVVLGVYSNGKYGALGLSRRRDLMYKPLEYPSMISLIQSYIKAYSKHHHKLVRVKIGLPIPHDPHRFETIPWKGLLITSNAFNRNTDCKHILEQYSRLIRRHTEAICVNPAAIHLPTLGYGLPPPTSYKHPWRQTQKVTVGSARTITRKKSRLVPASYQKGSTKSPRGIKEPILTANKEIMKPQAPAQYQVRV
ncbi:hypothetical protein CRM22_004919 [Opisthorchis felineus]|uniref:Vasohibin-2 n=1 Tax=Opisthorchis felineus TaxID=147828 RepID=A0A4S2LTX2_OPIFE|nr:hypothetical protein CRM22_004919 [Opisthorchis felineus]